MVKNKVVIVDDEKDILNLISDIVEDAGYKPIKAKNSQEAFAQIAENNPEAVILDIWLKESELDGLGILEFLKKKYSDLPIIMISGHGNIETALRSLKLGAYDYIEKPFKADKLINTVNKAVEYSRLVRENNSLTQKNQKIDYLFGDSNVIKNLRLELDRIAKTESRVFIKGEVGVGKEAIAHEVHALSKRVGASFVQLDVYNYEPNEIEEAIFGTEDAGNFNAPARKVGLLEIANGGTLYISEVCDLPKNIQQKLVKFLTDGKFTRVGGTKSVDSNVRVIASTNCIDLQKKIQEGELRSDLYSRLNVVELTIPSLAERRDDIPMLTEYFKNYFCAKYNLPRRRFTNEAFISLQSYDWPGNVRQLMNVVEWLLMMNPGEAADTLKSSMLPKEIVAGSAGDFLENGNKELMSLKLRDARQLFERQYLLAQINRFGGNISRTASFVGMERSALHRKLKSLDLSKAPGLKEMVG